MEDYVSYSGNYIGHDRCDIGVKESKANSALILNSEYI